MLKNTPLHDRHVKLGARMVPFAGFEMPLNYTSLKTEHLNVRENAGMFDVSHMGEFLVEGPEAMDLVQWVTSNDVSKLEVGQAQYSCLPNDRGGIVDDLLVYRLDDQAFLLVVNAANIEKDFSWIKAHNKTGAKLIDQSDHFALLAVQGPGAKDILQGLTSVKLSEIPFYRFTRGEIAGAREVIISATGYTGAGGFELYVPGGSAPGVWDAIMEEGRSASLLPTGLGARDTLRLEMGYCLYGNDITDDTSPLEAGLGWITKLNTDFIGKEVLEKQKREGLKRKLVGFEMIEKGIPRAEYVLLDQEGLPMGEVTSGSMSPCLNKGIGLGYVARDMAIYGQEIGVEIRGKSVGAVIRKLPLYSAS